jgi:hypothetical protein
MPTTRTEFLLSLPEHRIHWLEPMATAILPAGSLNEPGAHPPDRPHRLEVPVFLSKTFSAVVTALLLATGLFFWTQHEELQKRSAEIDRQNRVASKVYHAIERYTDSPNAWTDHEARVAMDLALEERLTENRQALLSNFYRSARRCHVGGKYGGSTQDCRRMAYNRFSAMNATLSEDLDSNY